MKLLKLLSEEFPMFNNFAKDSMGSGEEDPTGRMSPDGEEGMEGMGDEDTEGGEGCQCQCDCPCCQAARAKGFGDEEEGEEGEEGQQKLDFSAAHTGANLEDGGDDEFNFDSLGK